MFCFNWKIFFIFLYYNLKLFYSVGNYVYWFLNCGDNFERILFEIMLI